MDMNDACDRLARRDASDHLRMTRLEMLDEVEEFRMMLAHYCVAWGVNEKKRASNGGGALFDALSGL
jgi:tRNA wybutosine-synthesizing protein 4